MVIYVMAAQAHIRWGLAEAHAAPQMGKCRPMQSGQIRAITSNRSVGQQGCEPNV